MAKEKEKYHWDWGTQTFPTIDPHSKIKHTIINEYIQTYIDVLMRNQLMPELGLSIVDGFSGGGIYNTEASEEKHFGSPIISLDAIQESEVRNNLDRKKQRPILSQHHFVDVKRENISCLHSVLASRGHADRIGKDIYLHRGEFVQALPGITQNLKNFGRGERALFLLDQYGYSEVPFPTIKSIFRNLKNAEVLLTFNVDFLLAYLADQPANRKAIANIGLEKHVPWEQIKHLKAFEQNGWKSIIQKGLSQGIKEETGAQFMTVFFIRPLGSNSMNYWFIHLANNYRANDVMKSIHWKYGNNFTHYLSPAPFYGYDANKDINITGQPDLLLSCDEHSFDQATDSRINGELSELLPREIYNIEQQPFMKLMTGLTNFTMANEQRVKKSLDDVIANGDLVATDKDGKTKRRKGSSIKPTDILLAPPQRSMFFLPSFPNKTKPGQ